MTDADGLPPHFSGIADTASADHPAPEPSPDCDSTGPATTELGGDALRRALLLAGRAEFANHGYDGARLERIVARVGCAKRMLYYYFGNKKEVYLAVIEHCYHDIRNSEQQLNLDAFAPRQALHRLATQSFLYHEQNDEFTRLVLQENFQGGVLLRQVEHSTLLRQAAFEPLERILRRGAEAGVFRADVAPTDLHYLISALSAFRVDHSNTWRSLLEFDLRTEPARSRHLQLLLDQVDAFVAPRA